MTTLTKDQKTKIIEEAIETVRQGGDTSFFDVLESLVYAAGKFGVPASKISDLIRDDRLKSIKVSV